MLFIGVGWLLVYRCTLGWSVFCFFFFFKQKTAYEIFAQGPLNARHHQSSALPCKWTTLCDSAEFSDGDHTRRRSRHPSRGQSRGSSAPQDRPYYGPSR